MGHAIKHLIFDSNTSAIAILDECNESANYDGADYRDPIDRIRYIDKTFESREEAEKYIETADQGWYDQLAVKFKEPVLKPDTKAIKNEIEKLSQLRKEYVDKSSVP